MEGISFKQYLILRKLYKAKPCKILLDANSKDFQFLISNKYIESEQDYIDLNNDNIIGLLSTNNGLSTITIEGENIYRVYIDKYFSRAGIIASFVLSVISIIISIIALCKA